jgi:hypothetical protein
LAEDARISIAPGQKNFKISDGNLMRDTGPRFGELFSDSQFVGLCEEVSECAITATIKFCRRVTDELK